MEPQQLRPKLKLPLPLVVIKNVTLLVVFFIGCVSIVWTQYVFLIILQNHPTYKQDLINLTKKQFLQLLTFIITSASPIDISVTYDPKTIPSSNSFKAMTDNVLSSIMTPNSVLIANHQIYTDWFYLWWFSYTANMADNIYIILKDLSKIPILGYGMKNFNFMFLSRKWEKDKVLLTNQLLEIDANARGSGPAAGVNHVSSTNISSEFGGVKFWPEESVSDALYPYQIILYPEGTVPSPRTTKKSREFCEKNNLPLLKHVLLPRSRGLFLVLRKLRETATVVYDITTGYSGLESDQYGEDVFTLKKIFILGQGPPKICYHIRAFNIHEIPLGEETVDIDDVKEEDLKNFEQWLYNIWFEKDKLMEQFYKTGSFVQPDNPANSTIDKAESHTVNSQIKLRSNPLIEVLPIFATSFSTILLLRLAWFLLKAIFARFM